MAWNEIQRDVRERVIASGRRVCARLFAGGRESARAIASKADWRCSVFVKFKQVEVQGRGAKDAALRLAGGKLE